MGLQVAGAKYRGQEGVKRCKFSSGVRWHLVSVRCVSRNSLVTGLGILETPEDLLDTFFITTFRICFRRIPTDKKRIFIIFVLFTKIKYYFSAALS